MVLPNVLLFFAARFSDQRFFRNFADNVTITGMSMVTKSISESGSYSSGTPMLESLHWKRAAVRFKQLADVPLTQLLKRLDHIQTQIESLESTFKRK